MQVKDQIRKALTASLGAATASACAIFKGWEYDGVRQSYGWWSVPFGRSPIYLGPTGAEALAEIDAQLQARLEEAPLAARVD